MHSKNMQQRALRRQGPTVHSASGTSMFVTVCLGLSSATALSGSALAAEGWWRDPRNLESLITQHPNTPWVGDRLPASAKPAIEIPNAERPLTLAELSDLALRNNPQTRSAWAAARAAASQVGIELADYSVQASGALSYLRARQISQTGVRQPIIERYTPSVTLSYALFDFGSRASQVEAARFNLLAANLSQNRTLQAVIFAVEQAYYALLGSEQLVRSGQISLRNAQTTFEATERRRQSGLATIGDVFRAETAVAQARLALQQAEGLVAQARGRLAFSAGLPVTTRYTLAPVPAKLEATKLAESVTELVERAKTGRPDLVAAEATARSLSATARAAAAAGLPSITTTATFADNYFVSRPDGMNWTVGVAVNIPLFTGYRDTYTRRLAEANTERQIAVRDQLSNQVELDVWQGYFNVQTANTALTTAQSLVRTAAQSLEVAEARYKGGVGSLLEVITAQADDVNARVQQITAQVNWYTAFSQLNFALGSLPLVPGAATVPQGNAPVTSAPGAPYSPSLPVQK
ncbi:MAG: TolC family protein [Rhodocyclaceae bacterium]|nr:TolC family protein [Rhodocyclaceae bacterium]